METIGRAQEDVNIVSPYLIPTPKLMAAFSNLRQRGVRVRIITNSLHSTDNLFTQAGYRNLRQQMVAMGIEIYEYNGPDTIHAKVVVVDNRIAIIGTYNLDPRSERLNREVGIKIIDRNNNKLINEMNLAIEIFRRDATLISRDGIMQNQDIKDKGLTKKKKVILKALNFILPFIKNQL